MSKQEFSRLEVLLRVQSGRLRVADAFNQHQVALTAARKLYMDFNNPPPPFPDDVTTFPPCSILVTERRNIGTGERIGRVRFFRPDGSALSDQTWTVASASSQVGASAVV
jgi:hypothetical protein